MVENQQAAFHCSATGNPTPVITWIRDSETLNQGDTLTFKVNRNQSGKYWCSADNGLNITVNASANLSVLCKYQSIVYRPFLLPLHTVPKQCHPCLPGVELSSIALYSSQVQESGSEVILTGWPCLLVLSGQ